MYWPVGEQVGGLDVPIKTEELGGESGEIWETGGDHTYRAYTTSLARPLFFARCPVFGSQALHRSPRRARSEQKVTPTSARLNGRADTDTHLHKLPCGRVCCARVVGHLRQVLVSLPSKQGHTSVVGAHEDGAGPVRILECVC